MYNENLLIKIPEQMKKDLKKVAESKYQTVSDYVRSLITQDIERYLVTEKENEKEE